MLDDHLDPFITMREQNEMLCFHRQIRATQATSNHYDSNLVEVQAEFAQLFPRSCHMRPHRLGIFNAYGQIPIFLLLFKSALTVCK
ncbi:hypothetical protein T02_15753 [Trichinella nativa]|uniref:Uncharacterized protein n=1 Tax=Trichinella nativa TaxID=6335 RepID=A0A0V1KYN0_9BILA|nr:hypothetical protein T02_15753 [Trichinella nativa]